MIQANIHSGKFILVNETSGGLCILGGQVSYGIPRYVSSKSTCYRVRREMAGKFPDCVYAVYALVRKGKVGG